MELNSETYGNYKIRFFKDERTGWVTAVAKSAEYPDIEGGEPTKEMAFWTVKRTIDQQLNLMSFQNKVPERKPKPDPWTGKPKKYAGGLYEPGYSDPKIYFERLKKIREQKL